MPLSNAARFARGLGADWVVVTEIDSVRRDEYGVRITRHPVRTNRGVDTAYFTEEGQARIYTQDGQLAISVIQEGVVRVPRQAR